MLFGSVRVRAIPLNLTAKRKQADHRIDLKRSATVADLVKELERVLAEDATGSWHFRAR